MATPDTPDLDLWAENVTLRETNRRLEATLLNVARTALDALGSLYGDQEPGERAKRVVVEFERLGDGSQT
jgi:hypothetical protein